MANINVLGHSSHHHLSTAVTDCLTQINQKLQGRLPNLLLVFAHTSLDHTNLIKELKNQSPQAQILGITVSNLNLNPTSPTLAIVGTHFVNSKIITGLAYHNSNDPIQAATQLSSQILGQADNRSPIEILILSSQPLNQDIIHQTLIENFSSPIPIYNLLASPSIDAPAKIFFDTQISPNSIIAIGVYVDSYLNLAHYRTTLPIGIPQKITRSQGNVIYEVNNHPASTLYEQFLTSYKLNRLPQNQFANLTSTFPLCLFTSPNPTIINPISVDQNGSLTLPIEIPPHCFVSLATHDLTQLDIPISQSLTTLNNSPCTLSITSTNRHSDPAQIQAETELIQSTIQSSSLLTITTQGFTINSTPPFNFSQHGRLILNFL